MADSANWVPASEPEGRLGFNSIVLNIEIMSWPNYIPSNMREHNLIYLKRNGWEKVELGIMSLNEGLLPFKYLKNHWLIKLFFYINVCL